jgi:carbonic anhydrase
MIINHTDCGMLRFTDSELEDRLRKETRRAPIAPARFYSFTDAEANTKEQIPKRPVRCQKSAWPVSCGDG